MGGLLYEMLSGNAPYEGSNFMEILHKKANTMPAALSTFRNDVPPELEALIMRALSREPGERPRSMDEMGRELTTLANTLFPGFGMAPPVESDKFPRAGVLGALRGGAAQASGLYERMRQKYRYTSIALGVGGALVLFVGYLVTSAALHRRHAHHPPVVLPAAPHLPAVAPPPPVVPAAPPAPAVAAAPPDKEAADDAEPAKDDTARDDDGETGAKSKGRLAVVAAPPAADNRHMLQDAERLLHAERFAEAQALFEKVAKSKRDRKAALLGLAEIAFQEKNYAEAVQSAARAVDRGGGVKAHVLLGDAHFRLGQYKEAAQAYADALKLDPENASAKTGLALAQKRM